MWVLECFVKAVALLKHFEEGLYDATLCGRQAKDFLPTIIVCGIVMGWDVLQHKLVQQDHMNYSVTTKFLVEKMKNNTLYAHGMIWVKPYVNVLITMEFKIVLYRSSSCCNICKSDASLKPFIITAPLSHVRGSIWLTVVFIILYANLPFELAHFPLS